MGIDLKTRPRPLEVVGLDANWEHGSVDWYDEDRKFGWLKRDAGGDAFVHWRALKRCGINPRDLVDGGRVTFTVQPGRGRSPEVVQLRLS